ncbi:DNA-processing protein DprA [Pararobbsia silviterrae]|uniref:DNA-protecting protein DprA n=1 Tax=Pararobbsia silviterrae TaxID=1792498 RepID=A0A494Y7H8_9BURK|nr:DNA-processing protein DprA [Pararobbsia silviterrae]RKP58604.1 DNA-protecting protein DprA [Pararobbsia silviterrae]
MTSDPKRDETHRPKSPSHIRAQRLDPDELHAWLRLAWTPQLGPIRIRRLLDRFGLPVHIVNMRPAALEPYIGRAVADYLVGPHSAAFLADVDRVSAWLAETRHHLVVLGDPAYPPALLESPDPPPLLFVKGRLERLHPGPAGEPAIAVVGSRRATHAGRVQADKFARALGEAGVTVISGLAMGIDAVAHASALSTPGGTVAVVGTGADRIYPHENIDLGERIGIDGAIVSEWPLGTPPRPAHFPRRNRVIAALAKGVLVVEATPHSGSLITAQLAVDYGRDVYAIPGSVEASYKRGCNRLIREGAMLVESPVDLLAALGLVCPEAEVASGCGKAQRRSRSRSRHAQRPRHSHNASNTPNTPNTPNTLNLQEEQQEQQEQQERDGRRACVDSPSSTIRGRGFGACPSRLSRASGPSRAVEAVWEALGHDPTPLDVLIARTGFDGAAVQAAVLALELDGRVEWQSGCALVRTGA